MKKLILVRHGKSSWLNPQLKDHDRPLAKRGLRDIPDMAQRFLKRNIGLPDQLITSTALRASQTALITANELGLDESGISQSNRLYHASADILLETIQNTLDNKKFIFLFGHNPGFNDLINLLGEPLENLATTGYFGFKAKITSWKDFNRETAEFWLFDFPKNKN